MPELPEVEVTRRGIEPYVSGRKVQRVDVRTPALRWPIPADLAKTLRGHVVRNVERRGKYLLFEIDAGWFIVHLGMTGTLRVLRHVPHPPAAANHADRSQPTDGSRSAGRCYHPPVLELS